MIITCVVHTSLCKKKYRLESCNTCNRYKKASLRRFWKCILSLSIAFSRVSYKFFSYKHCDCLQSGLFNFWDWKWHIRSYNLNINRLSCMQGSIADLQLSIDLFFMLGHPQWIQIINASKQVVITVATIKYVKKKREEGNQLFSLFLHSCNNVISRSV